MEATPAAGAAAAESEPPPGNQEGDAMAPPRCDYSDSDSCLQQWLEVKQLHHDVVLTITGDDLYNSHVALRHLAEIDQQHHAIQMVMPLALRSNRGFTPWLASGKTVYRGKSEESPVKHGHLQSQSVCVMHFHAHAKHVHSNLVEHLASFDVRVAGAVTRSLLDTGATPSCISQRFAHRLDLPVDRSASLEEIGGVGGSMTALGTATVTIKIGKVQIQQRVLVLDAPIAGYDCILGQDFMRANSVGLVFSPYSITLTVGRDDDGKAQAQLVRRLDSSTSTSAHRHADAASMPYVLQATPVHDSDLAPESETATKHILHEVALGRQVAYRVVLTAVESTVDTQPDGVPECVDRVIKKHSQAGGTLCGTIPSNTHAKGYQCHIELVDGARPVNIRQYRLTPLEKEELLKQVQAFVDKGWIELSSSPWSSSVLFVPKPNGKLRFCVDYRGLNKVTKPDQGPIPLQGELLDQLQGQLYFTALDLASGFYQLELSKESREYSAFPTPLGLYQWKVMPMGLCNAPAVFQQAMNQILREHISKGYCMVYLDDIIIMSKTAEEHAAHLDAVLSSLNQHNLFCQLPKCQWAKKELKYLGHLVSGTGVKPDPKKVEALDKWLPPLAQVEELSDPSHSSRYVRGVKDRITSECRRFLGFMNYFHRFIPRFADIAVPLYQQTQKDPPLWTEACTHAWNTLKEVLKQATLMYHPDFSLPFHVYSDVSLTACGGVLIQIKEGEVQPIAFVSRKLVPAEINYSTTEQEMLALVYCMQQWRCYLEGSRCVMHTDHEPLTWLATQPRPNRRQARWLEFLSRFTSCELVYVKGDRNIVADALSRALNLATMATPFELPYDQLMDTVCAFSIIDSFSAAARADGPAVVLAALQRRLGRAQRGVLAYALRRRGLGVVDNSSSSRGCKRARSSSAEGVPCVTSNAMRDVSGGEIESTRERRVDRPTSASCDPLRAQRESVYPETRLLVPTSSQFGLDDETSDAEMREMEGDLTPTGRPLDQPDNVQRPSTVVPPPSQPPDPLASSHEVDPPLSQYELLYEQLFTRVEKLLVSDVLVQTDQQRELLGLQQVRGLLWKGVRLYIPNDTDLKQDLLWWHHDVPWCAHVGIQKTLELVKRQFYWPNMDADIKEYVQTCHKCQENKPNRQRWLPPLSPITAPDACWRTVGVDLIVDLPRSSKGYDAILVFTCHLSKMVRIVKTTSDLSSRGFAAKFFKHVFPHYGFPEQIVSDRGPQWNSEFFRDLCDIADMRLHMSTAYHPRTNGLVERANEVIETAIRHYVSADHENWPDKIPFIEFAMNDTYKDALGTSSFALNRITLPKAPFAAVVSNLAQHLRKADLLDLVKSDQGVNIEPQANARKKRGRPRKVQTSAAPAPTSDLARWLGSSQPSGIRTALQAHVDFAWARRCVELAKCRMKQTHDKKGVRHHLYEPGHYVWLSYQHISLRHPHARNKFVPRFFGPIKVIGKVGPNAVRLDLPQNLKCHPTVSVSLVKPYKARSGQEVAPVQIDGNLETEVVAVNDFNIVKSRSRKTANFVEFQVQWKGDFDLTWHEFDDLRNSMDVLETFMSKCTQQDRKRILQCLSDEQVRRFSNVFRNKANRE